MTARTEAKPATAGAAKTEKVKEVSEVERDITMTRRQIQTELDICLAAKIEAEKKGQTISVKLYNARVVALLNRMEKAVELG